MPAIQATAGVDRQNLALLLEEIDQRFGSMDAFLTGPIGPQQPEAGAPAGHLSGVNFAILGPHFWPFQPSSGRIFPPEDGFSKNIHKVAFSVHKNVPIFSDWFQLDWVSYACQQR